jgi:hypothetical protein
MLVILLGSHFRENFKTNIEKTNLSILLDLNPVDVYAYLMLILKNHVKYMSLFLDQKEGWPIPNCRQKIQGQSSMTQLGMLH